jgi:hypothetical protein
MGQLLEDQRWGTGGTAVSGGRKHKLRELGVIAGVVTLGACVLPLSVRADRRCPLTRPPSSPPPAARKPGRGPGGSPHSAAHPAHP